MSYRRRGPDDPCYHREPDRGPVIPLALILFILAAIVGHEHLDSVAAGLVAAIVLAAAGWGVYQLAEEWQHQRLYDRAEPEPEVLPARAVPLALSTAAPPRAIEPPPPLVVDCEYWADGPWAPLAEPIDLDRPEDR